MTDVLVQGRRWLERQRLRFLAHPVRYRRGGTVVEVSATIGRTIFRVESVNVVLERIEGRDYLIAAHELMAAGIALPPQRGDRIEEDADGRRWIYEVLAPGGEPPWRWSDPERHCLRIHTIYLSDQEIPA